jgi:2-dehydropantoate 2-reductase
MLDILPATHLEPGVVVADSAPTTGILDAGRYPHGVDPLIEAVTADLESATFRSRTDRAILRWKYAKLLSNLGNALQAACGDSPGASDLLDRARAEAQACYRAAGIDCAGTIEMEWRRRRGALKVSRGQAAGRQGSSSWQSLQRATGSIEADYLNGEIVLLGRRHGVPTPVNDLLQRTANRLARDRQPPGSVPLPDLLAQLSN